MSKYRTAPVPSTKMPKGIPYIIGNEFAERFSFYGMKGILVVFMTQYLMNHGGELDLMSNAEATEKYHLFTAAVYFTPLLGALIADLFFGKYLTIIALSLVYCLGHGVLALDDTRMGLALGLGLIALGAGGIKPCVSAHVGDQFGETNQPLLSKVFGWFYVSINIGAFLSNLLTPYLLQNFGPQYAFGLPGGLMLLATIVFWMGRKEFVHIPAGGKDFLKEVFTVEGLKALGKLSIHGRSWSSARTFFEQLLKLDPKNDEAYFALGEIAAAQGQTAVAIDHLEKSLGLNPGRTAARG